MNCSHGTGAGCANRINTQPKPPDHDRAALTRGAADAAFNGCVRLAHAREKIALWAEDYNTRRPHSSLGYATPAAFAADLKKQGAASLRIAGGYATQPLASPAHVGNNDAETLIATG